MLFAEDGEVVDLTKDEGDDTVKDPDYEKVVLYRHKPTGYYYDQVSCVVESSNLLGCLELCTVFVHVIKQ